MAFVFCHQEAQRRMSYKTKQLDTEPRGKRDRNMADVTLDTITDKIHSTDTHITDLNERVCASLQSLTASYAPSSAQGADTELRQRSCYILPHMYSREGEHTEKGAHGPPDSTAAPGAESFSTTDLETVFSSTQSSPRLCIRLSVITTDLPLSL